ncbi:MAG: SH3 domain-containing protein [Anaerolineales bacterium]|nr:SH3 domain-containing protein [Anaerolineales bacterium]
MTPHKRTTAIVSFLLLFSLLPACNLPKKDDLTTEQKAATAVAQTLTAIGPPSETPTAKATATLKPTATITPTTEPTYSLPMLKINESTNCRSGPGQEFEILNTFLPGASVKILGAYPGYWIVEYEESKSCWVWGEYAEASGSHWTAPTMTAPPFPTIAPPATPVNLKYEYVCEWNGANLEAKVSLSWNGASNVLGYLLYRNDVQIADLTPNITNYTDISITTGGESITYSLQAWNNGGKSARNSFSFACK